RPPRLRRRPVRSAAPVPHAVQHRLALRRLDRPAPPHRPRRRFVPAPALDARVLVRLSRRSRRLASPPPALSGPGNHHPAPPPRRGPGGWGVAADAFVAAGG